MAHAEKSMSKQTFKEKKAVLKSFLAYCRKADSTSLEKMDKPLIYQYLAAIANERGPARANVYRKNLLAGWSWGRLAVKGFPRGESPLSLVKPFPVDEKERYVPPEEDVVKVMEQASGQDLVMLMVFYYTGARRGEVFRLVWDDVDFAARRLRLVDHKGDGGAKRVRWSPIHPELDKALRWWRDVRPCAVDNVFMQIHCKATFGQPFSQRSKLMGTLCDRAKVKPFGFHAMRHKAAAIIFERGGLCAAQSLMGHSRATTTDRYVRSAGLYGDQSVIVAALGESSIGQQIGEIFEKVMPHEVVTHGASCNRETVTSCLQ